MARWALIAGESGKENAACAAAVVERLSGAGVRAAGVVQRKTRDEHGAKRYDLERLGSGERALLAVDGVAAKGPDQEFFCSMAFHNDAFATARRWVEEDAGEADLLVLDGISKLESSGKGHSATLEAALRRDGPVVLLCVRSSQLSCVVERFGLQEADLVAFVELPADEVALERFAGELGRGCGSKAR